MTFRKLKKFICTIDRKKETKRKNKCEIAVCDIGVIW